MRLSVLVLDVLVFFTAVLALRRLLVTKRLASGHAAPPWTVVAALLLCPVYVLIDHGHFQYNSVAIGFLLWALVAALHGV